jgi:hypothetical protein
MPDFWETLLNAAVTGMGTAVGAFLGTKLVVHRLEALLSKFKNGEEAKP